VNRNRRLSSENEDAPPVNENDYMDVLCFKRVSKRAVYLTITGIVLIILYIIFAIFMIKSEDESSKASSDTQSYYSKVVGYFVFDGNSDPKFLWINTQNF